MRIKLGSFVECFCDVKQKNGLQTREAEIEYII